MAGAAAKLKSKSEEGQRPLLRHVTSLPACVLPEPKDAASAVWNGAVGSSVVAAEDGPAMVRMRHPCCSVGGKFLEQT